MRSIVKLALVVLVAVMCMSASAPTSVSAESLFITESGKTLLFTADSLGAVTFRGKRAGAEGTIKCEKSSAHGFALNESSLAREIHLELSGKCEQEVLGSKGTCTEPIKPVLSDGELGLLNGHALLLVAPEKGTGFVEVKCTNGNTSIEGAVIGEFKLDDRNGSLQYGLAEKALLLLSKASGVKQEPEEIELLGSLMKGVTLKAEGFLGEKAAEEAVQLLLFEGSAEVLIGVLSINKPTARLEVSQGATAKENYQYKNDGPGPWRANLSVVVYPDGPEDVWNIKNGCTRQEVQQGNNCIVEVEFLSAKATLNLANEVKIGMANSPTSATVGVAK